MTGSSEPPDSADLQYDSPDALHHVRTGGNIVTQEMDAELTERQGKEVSACFLAKSQVCSGSDGFLSLGQESAGVYLGWQCMLCLKGKG